MDVVNSVAAENIFISTASQQSQLDELANRALSNGIDLYMRKDYEGAAKEFQRSIGLAPQSQYSVDASNYMANAYLQLNQTEKAIKAYKTSISLNPYRDDTHIMLGNLYFSKNRYREAENEYKQAVRLNPTENNYYALGQAYNFGLPVPSTEMSISPYPDYVYYDSEASTATVYFTIHQNASADGTIDPSHIEFKFNSEDRYGFIMDPERDQFSGFSKVA